VRAAVRLQRAAERRVRIRQQLRREVGRAHQRVERQRLHLGGALAAHHGLGGGALVALDTLVQRGERRRHGRPGHAHQARGRHLHAQLHHGVVVEAGQRALARDVEHQALSARSPQRRQHLHRHVAEARRAAVVAEHRRCPLGLLREVAIVARQLVQDDLRARRAPARQGHEQLGVRIVRKV
jgi:hypothetical protein